MFPKGRQLIKGELKAAIYLISRGYDGLSARLSVCFFRTSRRVRVEWEKASSARWELQVVVPDSLKSVVTMEVVAADVVG